MARVKHGLLPYNQSWYRMQKKTSWHKLSSKLVLTSIPGWATFTRPFYLWRGDGGEWLISVVGFEVTGSLCPKLVWNHIKTMNPVFVHFWQIMNNYGYFHSADSMRIVSSNIFWRDSIACRDIFQCMSKGAVAFLEETTSYVFYFLCEIVEKITYVLLPKVSVSTGLLTLIFRRAVNQIRSRVELLINSDQFTSYRHKHLRYCLHTLNRACNI